MELSKEQSKSYLKLLINIFQFLATSSEYRRNAYDSIETIQTALSKLKAISATQCEDWNFSLTPNIEFEISTKSFCGPRGKTHLVIGGQLNVEKGLLKDQSITVCVVSTAESELDEEQKKKHCCGTWNTSLRTVVRRFHFDLDPGQLRRDRPPIHLQYGGKFDSCHLASGFDYNYELFQAIDLPRLPSPPYDFILLLDMLLKQFGVNVSGITQESRWRSLVRCSETLWLLPYFQKITDYLGSADRVNSVYEQLCEPISIT